MAPWTEREIERGLAFRTNDGGEIVAFEICADCRHGWPKEDRKLGYGRRALCRNCWALERNAEINNDDDIVLKNMGDGGWMLSMLAKTCRLTQDRTEQSLRNLEKSGKVARKGKMWSRVTELF